MDREKITEEFNNIVKAFKENILANLSKEQLGDYHNFLSKHGAIGGFNTEQYFHMCEHIRTLIVIKTKEESDVKRHQEIQNKLEELKKPHWTVNPNFWFTSIAAISGVVGCILTWNSSQQQLVEAKKSNDLNLNP